MLDRNVVLTIVRQAHVEASILLMGDLVGLAHPQWHPLFILRILEGLVGLLVELLLTIV